MNKSAGLLWLRSYFIAVGLAVLGCAIWKYNASIHSPQHGGWEALSWRALVNLGPYLVYAVLLLSPWWRLGDVCYTMGVAIILPACLYVTLSLLVVDLLHFHQQIWFQVLLLTAFSAQFVWLFMLPGAKEDGEREGVVCEEQPESTEEEDWDVVEEIVVGIEDQTYLPDTTPGAGGGAGTARQIG